MSYNMKVRMDEYLSNGRVCHELKVFSNVFSRSREMESVLV